MPREKSPSAPPPSVKDLVARMVRDDVFPLLEPHGFRRTGRALWRSNAHVCQVIDFVMNRWGTSDRGRFSTELGVRWHGIPSRIDEATDVKLPPPYHRCTFHLNLGWTTPRRAENLSIEVRRESDYPTIARNLVREIISYGFEWFEYRSNLAHVFEWERYRSPVGEGLWSSPEHKDTQIPQAALRRLIDSDGVCGGQHPSQAS